MVDLVLNPVKIPIPSPRPIIEWYTDAGMPLESPEKPADALFSTGGTLPTPENKSSSMGFLEAWTPIYEEWMKYMTELYSQFYGWLPDYSLNSFDWTAIVLLLVAAVALVWVSK